jgi:hypothetical protein
VFAAWEAARMPQGSASLPGLITCTLFLFVLLWTLSPLGWWRSLIAAVAGAAAARFIFQNLLNVVLPALPFAF